MSLKPKGWAMLNAEAVSKKAFGGAKVFFFFVCFLVGVCFLIMVWT